MHKGSVRTAQ